jgi:hypothetical protein
VSPQGVVEAIILLQPQWTTQVAATAWNTLRQKIHQEVCSLAAQCNAIQPAQAAYGLAIVPPTLAAEVEEVCRMLLVFDLVNTLATDQNVAPAQRELQTAQDVQTALTFRNVVLNPPTIFANPAVPLPVLARQPGVTDLSVVNDEWNRYIPGELANVVNVLPGEALDSRTFHLEKTVNTTASSTQQTTSSTVTNSQTTSSVLSQTATNTASTNIGAHAQVEASGSFGPMQIKTNVGAQVQTSKSSSTTLARTIAMQTVASSVKTVSETITQAQSNRTTIKDTDTQRHKLANTAANPTIVGLYRWLSVVHRCQVVTYPNRLILEFEIPEPGAWLRWALYAQPDTPWSNANPGPFSTDGNPLQQPDANGTIGNLIAPTAITPALASNLAGRWRIQGLSQPPPKTVTVGQSYSLPTTNPGAVNDNSISVPDGYVATTWNATMSIEGGDDAHFTDIWVSVGSLGVDSTFANPGNVRAQTQQFNITSQQVGGINTGTIPVNIYGFYTLGGACNVTVNCEQITDAGGNGVLYLQWQQNVFDEAVSAYNTLLSNYNQERVARAQQQSGPIVVGPPDLNLARSVMELKKLVIQNLLGQPLAPNELWNPPAGPPNNYGPSLNPPATAPASPVVQFFEQVFEWENIVYICYPYFWGGQSTWLQNATWASTSPSDPLFDQFLNAGSARVVVPARPGFEKLVNWYLSTGMIWGGQSPPGPNEPNYLSIADEIESIQVGATDGTPVDPWWEITLPTTYLWAGADPTTLPVNPNPTIGPPPAAGGAASVQGAGSTQGTSAVQGAASTQGANTMQGAAGSTQGAATVQGAGSTQGASTLQGAGSTQGASTLQGAAGSTQGAATASPQGQATGRSTRKAR